MKEYSTPSISITKFDSHVVTDLSDNGGNGLNTDQTTWSAIEKKLDKRIVKLQDIMSVQ